MAVEVAPVQTNGSSLTRDTIANNSDASFDEKLEQEKARLGLLFSPFSQFLPNGPQLFSDLSKMEQNFDEHNRQAESRNKAITQDHSSFDNKAPIKTLNYSSASLTADPQVKRFFLQELLSKSDWSIPNLEAKPSLSQALAAGRLMPKYDLQALIDQILEQVKLVKEKGKTELTMTLKPEDLEEIMLTITSKAGMVSIKLTAPDETGRLIEDNLAELEKALKEARVKLAELKVETVKKGKS